MKSFIWKQLLNSELRQKMGEARKNRVLKEFALEEEGQHIGLGIHIGLPF
ncbi:MAG: hypothetical protein P8K10_04375 [Crocinitomicaceae bacterium]|nr:hypothetical protein [Crocinitomicaceae bacterium]